jgi:quercetin dioxygenase-like cupin family protein
VAALPPDECAARARRAAALVDVAALEDQAAPPGTGSSESVVLWEDEDSIAWLNVVPDPRDTGFHDHDGSAVGVYVIAGTVTNEGLPIGATRRVRRYRAGDSFWVPATGIHRMNHEAGAVTVHVYSPPLRAIGYYEVVNGLLQRVPGPPDEASPESPRLLATLTGGTNWTEPRPVEAPVAAVPPPHAGRH